MKNKLMKQANKLTLLLGLGGLNGSVSIAALAGLFRIENAPLMAVLFMAGPASIITAILLDGNMKERMFAALIAGIIATAIVVFAAGAGTRLLSFLEISVLKVAGGIAILTIGLLVMGIKIPEKTPIIIILAGLFISMFWRLR